MTRTEFYGDEGLRIIWHGIVEDPTATVSAQPTEGDVVRREDTVFAHGSMHQVELAGPTDADRITASFLVHQEADSVAVWARWEEPGQDHAFEYEMVKAILESADPLEEGGA